MPAPPVLKTKRLDLLFSRLLPLTVSVSSSAPGASSWHAGAIHCLSGSKFRLTPG